MCCFKKEITVFKGRENRKKKITAIIQVTSWIQITDCFVYIHKHLNINNMHNSIIHAPVGFISQYDFQSSFRVHINEQIHSSLNNKIESKNKTEKKEWRKKKNFKSHVNNTLFNSVFLSSTSSFFILRDQFFYAAQPPYTATYTWIAKQFIIKLCMYDCSNAICW